MVITTTKQFKVVCERCGKTEYADDKPENYNKLLAMGYVEVKFSDTIKTVKQGGVCQECYEEFCELAQNFFDDVNKENEGKTFEKPDAIVLYDDPRYHGAYYKCPLCGVKFGSWFIDPKDVRCPGCLAELGGIK